MKHPLEKGRSLRERSVRLQAQSKYLRKLVWEQHYETLLLMNIPVASKQECRGASPRITIVVATHPDVSPIRYTLEREVGMGEGEFIGSSGAATEFLRAELLAGMTRANIAQNTSDESKKQRNRREARKAYDAVLRFLPQTFLSHDEEEQIDSKLAELKSALRSLGEEV